MCSIAAVVITVVVVKYVTSANTGAGCGTFARLLRRVPLRSVKIIIVGWQILTQVSFEVSSVLKANTNENQLCKCLVNLIFFR